MNNRTVGSKGILGIVVLTLRSDDGEVRFVGSECIVLFLLVLLVLDGGNLHEWAGWWAGRRGSICECNGLSHNRSLSGCLGSGMDQLYAADRDSSRSGVAGSRGCSDDWGWGAGRTSTCFLAKASKLLAYFGERLRAEAAGGGVSKAAVGGRSGGAGRAVCFCLRHPRQLWELLRAGGRRRRDGGSCRCG